MKKTIRIIYCIFLVGFLSFNVAARNIIDLGSSPWKFSKVMPTTPNIASLCEFITVDGQDTKSLTDNNMNTVWKFSSNEKQSIIIDTKGNRNISYIIFKFKDTRIERFFYKIESSNNRNEGWRNIIDRLNNPMTVAYKEVETVAEVENTVGHTRQKVYAFVNEGIKKPWNPPTQSYDFIQLSFNGAQDKNGNNLPLEISEIEVLEDEDLSNMQPASVIQGNYDDSKWETVGIPHCFNDMDTYLNDSEVAMWTGESWYRKSLFIDKKYKGKRIFLEFQGVNSGSAVYINGKFKKGNTIVQQPGEVTHVGCFIPFAIDITDDVLPGKENMLVVRVSNANNSFFTWPGFGNFTPFGMGWGGIVCPVSMIVTDDVHIPLNTYSGTSKWGTYNATIYIKENEAGLRFQTQVDNKGKDSKDITLQTLILDAEGKEAGRITSSKQIQNNSSIEFDQELKLQNPTLWYPNSSLYGKPYLYTIIRNVLHKGKVIDSYRERLGIRTITWDGDYCYVNNKKHLLNGFGYRNIYPALGSAMPAELIWKDAYHIAACGGNTLRVGHLPPSREMMNACDEYGIMVMLNSGDDEWSLKNEPAKTYKAEYDRNIIIAYRNHPSVVIWESNNGLAYDGDKYMPMKTLDMVEKWDSLQPRAVLNRDGYINEWNKSKTLIVGYSNRYSKIEGCPSINTEVYGANWEGRACWNAARFDYENEKKLSNWYVKNYIEDLENKACGWIDWMLAETQGEGYTIYLNGKHHQKSLGSSAMDANRFPKLKYRIYEKALWTPYEVKPGVALQSHWNLSGIQDVDAWSNCPYVEMFVNDKSYGIRTPDSKTKNCSWENLVWQKGKVRIVGMNAHKEIICEDVIETAEEPYAIELSVEETLTTPSGHKFTRQANGSDVIIITARIVDKNGVWHPLCNQNIRFEIEGEGVYKGSSDFYITAGKDINYHAPGDKELSLEGGLVRIAIRSTFNPGKVTVKAFSENLRQGEVTYTFSPQSKITNNIIKK